MFISALFKIAKLWKKPRCWSTDEWIKKMLYGILLSCKKRMKLGHLKINRWNWRSSF
jgi:hypothetical protein